MKIKVSKFKELGANIVFGFIGAELLKDFAKYTSLIDQNANNYNSLPAFCITLVGVTLGSMVSNFLIKKLKNKENSIFEFTENTSNENSKIINFKDWYRPNEIPALQDNSMDENFVEESAKVIPVSFKKPKP